MSDMRIKTMVLGSVQTNCYIVYHEEIKAAVIIDPADGSSAIQAACTEQASAASPRRQ